MRNLKNWIGKTSAGFIRFLARKLHLSLLDMGLSEAGYTKSYNLEASGELSFISRFLKQYIRAEKPVFFDVGSNNGEYASLLRKYHPSAEIHCFEPNPATFEQLQKNLPGEKFLNKYGLSDNESETELFFQADNQTSVQASLDKNILKNIAGSANISSAKVQLTTLDNYCSSRHIDTIDFLKIDTEGFELETLAGAKELLNSGKIKCIQFEFNEVNIEKRRFIKDFYAVLAGYEFFRLDKNKMIPMGAWKTEHEVFRFQNIVAVLKNG